MRLGTSWPTVTVPRPYGSGFICSRCPPLPFSPFAVRVGGFSRRLCPCERSGGTAALGAPLFCPGRGVVFFPWRADVALLFRLSTVSSVAFSPGYFVAPTVDGVKGRGRSLSLGVRNSGLFTSTGFLLRCVRLACVDSRGRVFSGPYRGWFSHL